MTEPQKLLAAYADHGSEEAFRELVERYAGLVHSAALRILGGDAHAAEDVTQIVFLHLARNARKLSRDSLVGGWLHRDACNVAAKSLRSDHRRNARELEAALMKSIPEHSDANLEAVAPVLDQAINLLGRADRAAILLRYFEQRDFRGVAAGLGEKEDAARMRVNRALEKLRLILKRRGVALSAAALGGLLADPALSALPLGLAASVSGTVLGVSTGGTWGALSFLRIMTLTKLKTGLVAAALVGSVAGVFMIRSAAQGAQRRLDQALAAQSDEMARLAGDRQKLSELLEQSARKSDTLKELPGLLAEAGALRQKVKELARLRDENKSLRQAAPKPKSPLQFKEMSTAKSLHARDWVTAFRIYAREHQGQLPTTFDQAAPSLLPGASGENSPPGDEFEIAYHGSLDSLMSKTNWQETIVVQAVEPWLSNDGQWVKAYGMAGGFGQLVTLPVHWDEPGLGRVVYNTFEAFEQAHAAPQPGQ